MLRSDTSSDFRCLLHDVAVHPSNGSGFSKNLLYEMHATTQAVACGGELTADLLLVVEPRADQPLESESDSEAWQIATRRHEELLVTRYEQKVD